MPQLKHSLLTPVILAGGQGKRLTPLSTPQRPKQFLNLLHPSKSLLQQTLERAAFISAERAMVMTLAEYAPVATQQAEGFKAFLLYEPAAYNTAYSILCAAYSLYTQHRQETLMLVMPCDHYIEDSFQLKDAVEHGIPLGHEGKIVAFGIPPTFPSTQYGYLRAEGTRLVQFLEKPLEAQAAEILGAGECFWNSGIFLFSALTVLKEARVHAPLLLHQARHSVLFSRQSNKALYLAKPPDCPSLSFDHAIMESTSHGAVIPLGSVWSDIGSWEMLSAAQQRNKEAERQKAKMKDAPASTEPGRSPTWEGEEKWSKSDPATASNTYIENDV